MTDPPVDVDHERGTLQGQPQVWVDRAGGVQIAHPVQLGMDAESVERGEVRAHEGPRVVRSGGRLVGRRGHTHEWRAHVAVDRVARQQRLVVHRVHVVDAVEESRVDTTLAQRPPDRVVDDRAAQAADMDGS